LDGHRFGEFKRPARHVVPATLTNRGAMPMDRGRSHDYWIGKSAMATNSWVPDGLAVDHFELAGLDDPAHPGEKVRGG